MNRYYEVINNLKNGVSAEEIDYIYKKRDLYLPLLMLTIAKLNIANNYIGGIAAFIIFCLKVLI